MTKRWKISLSLVGLSVLAFVATLSIAPAQADLFDGPVDRLPVAERVALREGKIVVTGSEGQYLGKVLVTASPDVVWSVLTDYDNLYKFLPNVISSQVLETNGNRKIVEQISNRKILLVNVKSRVRTENTETNKQRIDFRLVEGDLQQLQGHWTIESVSLHPGAEPTQVLISQEVEAQPKSGTPKDIFYDIFKRAMGDNLKAIQKEVNQRTTESR